MHIFLVSELLRLFAVSERTLRWTTTAFAFAVVISTYVDCKLDACAQSRVAAREWAKKKQKLQA